MKDNAMEGAPIEVPESFNYIGCFITFACPYGCSYCINRFGGMSGLRQRILPGRVWSSFFRRLKTSIPITLQGGEPGSHPDFIQIVKETLDFHSVDILSNLTFDLDAFIGEIDPEKMNREAPYAPIRASYHPEQFDLEVIVHRLLKLQGAGFRVGLYGVNHPDQVEKNLEAKKVCDKLGIDFRYKPFLGWYEGRLHGDYFMPQAVGGKVIGSADCAPSEVLISPHGELHRCHHYLYSGGKALGHIEDEQIRLSDNYMPCNQLGMCNPCDLKVKNNRFQQFGHVTIRIKNVDLNEK
jgi:hypothetical protein